MSEAKEPFRVSALIGVDAVGDICEAGWRDGPGQRGADARKKAEVGNCWFKRPKAGQIGENVGCLATRQCYYEAHAWSTLVRVFQQASSALQVLQCPVCRICEWGLQRSRCVG